VLALRRARYPLGRFSVPWGRRAAFHGMKFAFSVALLRAYDDFLSFIDALMRQERLSAPA